MCADGTFSVTGLNLLSNGPCWLPFPTGLAALCDGLRHCSFTLILDLSHNAIGDAGAAALAAVLGNLSSVINVQLGGNNDLGDLGAAALAAAARSCPSLRRIALRGTAASIYSVKDINSALNANAKRAALARGKSGNSLANAIASVVDAAASGITVGPDRPITWDGSWGGAMPTKVAAAALPGLVSVAAAVGKPRATVSSSGRRASSSSTNGEDPVFVAQLCGLLRTLVQPVLPAEMAVGRLVSELMAQRQAQGNAASEQQPQPQQPQNQEDIFRFSGSKLDVSINPRRQRPARVSELDCIADEATVAATAAPFPDLAPSFDAVSGSSGSGSPSGEAEVEGRGAAETAALLSYLANGLTQYGYDVAVTHKQGGGPGGQCLRNLRHTFLSITCPRQHPNAASNANSAPCSLTAAGALAEAAATATLPSTGSLGGGSRVGLAQPYGTTAVQMPYHAGVIIVDPELREQFDVANPTSRYEALVGTLPRVYVGAEERLPLVVEVSRATKLPFSVNRCRHDSACLATAVLQAVNVLSKACFPMHLSAQQCTALNLAACRTRFRVLPGARYVLLHAERSLLPVAPIMRRCCATRWPWRSAPRARCSLPGANQPP